MIVGSSLPLEVGRVYRTTTTPMILEEAEEDLPVVIAAVVILRTATVDEWVSCLLEQSPDDTVETALAGKDAAGFEYFYEISID